MGLAHREQSKISEEGVRPAFVIGEATPPTRAVLLFAQHGPQATPNKAVEGGEGGSMGMSKVPKPALERWVERLNHRFERLARRPLRPEADLVSQRHQTLLANVALASFKPISKKLKPLPYHPTIPNVGLVGMQRQTVRSDPRTHAGERSFRFLPSATQHHGIIGVAHHHQPRLTHLYVKLVKVDVGEQWADNRPLRTARDRRPALQIFHDVLLEKLLDEPHHPSVRNPSSHLRKKAGVWNRVVGRDGP